LAQVRERWRYDPVAHGLIADVGHLFERDMPDSRENKKTGLGQFALEVASGVETDGAVAISPDEEHWFGGDSGEHAAENLHVGGPAVDDLEDVVDGARDAETVSVAV
jgi:hypothetical protein